VDRRLEELDWQATPLGEISLRRRIDPMLDIEVYEVRLGEEFLMSSLFTVAEVQLAQLGLAATTGSALDVVVGGLGLGYTARAVLADDRVRSLEVLEALPAVIAWQQNYLLPDAAALVEDPRCRLVEGDFFAALAGPGSSAGGTARWHAILVDIDHSPTHVLHPSHAAFYTAPGLRRLADRLHPGGVFGLWSDDPPDDHFLEVLAAVFDDVEAHVVDFGNPFTGGQSANTVYVARRRARTQA
jgi:spermidine synthase